MGTIIAVLNQDKTLNISTDSLILSGENLTTNLLISIPASMRDYDYYLEFFCPNELCLSTNKLELIEGSIEFAIPYEVIKLSGRVDIQLVARLNLSETLVFKSTLIHINIENSINADNILSDNFQDVIVKCENITEEATIAVIECNDATKNCVNVANNALIVSNECIIATDEARDIIVTANDKINETNLVINACSQATNNAIDSTNLANSAINDSVIATDLANQATLSANLAASDAQLARVEAFNAAISAENATIQAQLATENSFIAINDINNKILETNLVINSANITINDLSIIKQETLNAKEQTLNATANANIVTLNAENAITECSQATIDANQASLLANQATINANSATNNAIEKTNNMDILYNSVLLDVENNNYDGKSAYQYAIENGYIGTEAEFAEALSNASDYLTSQRIDKTYANSIKTAFCGQNINLYKCRDNLQIDNLLIHSEKTIASLPSSYLSNYNLPESKNLIISVKNSNDASQYQNINVVLPYPFFNIEGARDEIVWDNIEKRFYIIYRTQCINMADINWVYLSGALPNVITAAYLAQSFPYDIDLDTQYYECGSMVNYYGQELVNNDMEGIAINYILETKSCIIRIPRSIFSDTSNINTFFANNTHKIIIKLKNPIVIPLDIVISDAIDELRLYRPSSNIRAFTGDNEYYVSGDYYLDSKLLIESKASLELDNNYIGNQNIIGDMNIEGVLKINDNTLTLRGNKLNSIDTGDRSGLVVKKINGTNDAKLMFDRYGNLSAGLDNNIKTIAEREDSPKNMCFAYWDEVQGKMKTSINYKTTNFLKQIITDNIIITASNWVANNNKFEYQIITIILKIHHLLW